MRVQTAATLGLAWYGTASASAFPTYCLQPTAPPVVTLTFPDGRVQEFEVRCRGWAAHSPRCRRPASRSPRSTPRRSASRRVGPTLGKLELVGSDERGGDRELAGPDAALRLRLQPVRPGPLPVHGPRRPGVRGRQDGRAQEPDRPSRQRADDDARPGSRPRTRRCAGSTLGIVFQRDAEGRITRITDPQGRSLVYAYDANGDLAVRHRPRGAARRASRYLEDPAHHLETIQDPLGRTPIRNEYDHERAPDAHTSTRSARGSSTSTTSLGRQEIVKDRDGRPARARVRRARQRGPRDRPAGQGRRPHASTPATTA